MKRWFIFLFTVIFCWLLTASSVLATEEFETNYDVRYQALENGQMTVTQNISLTNKLANVYATQYSLTLQSVKIENVRANDHQGPLQVEISQDEEETFITLDFNQPVVGKDKTLNFTLSYEAPDLAQKNGQIWEVNIPRLSEESQPDQFQLTLTVPQTFGKLAFIRPKPASQEEKEGWKIYRFNKNQALVSNISASFGEFQIFDFVLAYHLENPNSAKIETEIAIPPDTAFQQVLYSQINPEPLNVRVDNDGNWLAKYQLAAREKLNVNVSGQAKIFSQSQNNFLLPSTENLNHNLLPQKYWPVDDHQIQTKAQSLKTPKSIYQFVVNHLEYNFDRVKEGSERLGALQALENPKQAICMEFTDLFVTLVRAAGIPAREVNGFAYTTNVRLRPLSLVSDILHAWPEYWDENKRIWVPVDPTWEKTTGGVDYFSKTDLNHFVFIIHGESDELPHPPGSYKTATNFGKDIQVAFGQYSQEAKPQIEVNFDLPKKMFWWAKNKASVTIQNKGSSALYNLNPEISSSTLDIQFLEPADKNISLLPPKAKQKIELELKAIKLFKSQSDLISVTVNGQKFSQPLKIVFLSRELELAGLGGGIILIVLFLTRPWNYVRKRQA